MEYLQDGERFLLMSSHITSDLEKIADSVTFIDKGKLLILGYKDDILESHGILKCDRSELGNIAPEDIVSVRMNTYGAEVMLRDRQSASYKYSGAMMLRFGEKKGSIINVIIMLCIAIAAILLLSFVPMEIQDKIFAWLAGFLTNDFTDLTVLLMGLFPGISVGAYILSYKISCRIFMKGVSEYDK